MPGRNRAKSFSTFLFFVSHGSVAVTTAAAFFSASFLSLTHPWKDMQDTSLQTFAVTANQAAPPDAVAVTANQTAPLDAVAATANQTAPLDAIAAPANQTAPLDVIAATANQTAPLDVIAATANQTAPLDVVAVTANQAAPPDAVAATANQAAPAAVPREVRLHYPASPPTVALASSPRLLAAFAQAAARKGITLDQYRDARLRFLMQQLAQLELRLTVPNLSAAETSRLERQKVYWGRAIAETMALP
jgi:hypothetical protein